ncbi:Glyoxalase domain-containing protein 4 [Argiope bruennichi]|uniref:Glyoxalase domain-containing protein 4 n=1 Tax=Argiope bruennichi TaxID=94029 RepID=A0A8T0E0K6_ARGBR|nr:Glyoxalase domain-containing protein 4 [Argiope bruennichi]
MSARRALHFVFKVGDRKDTIKFYTEVLGMKVLRHEEFEEGCKASCNGPYDGKWSKTMIGYGPEDDHFITKGWPTKKDNNVAILEAPGGYKYFICDQQKSNSADPVQKVSLACSNLQKSLCKLELKDIGGPVNHEQAFGRIAFSCPTSELAGIQDAVKNSGYKILTPLVSLDTPGKATVHVVILADPDGHEICFVGDEAFRELSKVDPKGEGLLKEAIDADKSDEWFAKKGLSKVEK